MCFAHLKRILKLDRLRLRGPCGARDEFLLAATVQNLRKMAKLISATGPILSAQGVQTATTSPASSRCRRAACPSDDFFNTIDPKQTRIDQDQRGPVASAAYLFALPSWLPTFLVDLDGADLLVRAGLCVLVLTPAGFLMDFGFPTGMRPVSAINTGPCHGSGASTVLQACSPHASPLPPALP
jgi:hypothetical protein